eukprot:m.256381 g.256381  ORF g.256381 m.256381 type:complete len:157 (+) comp26570_c0_seq15:4584-5054(+)
MPYNKSVTIDNSHAYQLLREEQRLKLAHDVLGRVVRKGGRVHTSDLQYAGFWDLLGEFWGCYGWQERRRLARARDFDAAFFELVLDGAGYSTTRVREGVLHVDSGMLRQGLDRLKSADDLRAGLRTFRLDEVRKGRSKLSGSALAKTTPCAKTPLH